MAFLFFTHFHITNAPTPSFAPAFGEKNFGQYGKRDWYQHHVFFAGDPTVAMKYENHRSRIKRLHERNNISISKVTHATRYFFAQAARTNGASESGTKALGGWNEGSGSFRQCYERTFPIDALLAAGMFPAKKPENYALPRNELNPPEELLANIFPWVEGELEALRRRVAADRRCEDYALRHFLAVLQWFRRVILQDAAILYSTDSSYALWTYPPFCTSAFQSFARSARPLLEEAAELSRATYEQVPEHLAAGIREVTTGLLFSQRQHQQHLDGRISALAQLISSSLTSTAQDGLPLLTTMPAWAAPPSASPISNQSLNSHESSIAATPSTSTAMTTPAAATAAVPVSPSTSYLPNPAFVMAPANAYSALSIDPIIQQQQAQQQELIAKYGHEKFLRHQPWTWKGGELRPTYDFQEASTIRDVWNEWSEGLNGYLPVRVLTEVWATKWRSGSDSKRTAFSRRKKIIDIVEKLAHKPRWSVDMALRFLEKTYGKLSAQQFIKFLSSAKEAGETQVMNAAINFTS